MWHTTGWAITTGLKITVVLAAGVSGVWLLTDSPGYLITALIVAGLVAVWVLRALCRQWAHEARLWCWWWPK